jgi:uncharacterized protein YbjT (DUF2867 family)
VKVAVFGATGMVGQGVLRECVLAEDVQEVVVIGRSSVGRRHRKLRELIVADPADLTGVRGDLEPLDACFFCLGVSSVGMPTEKYQRITYDLTLAVAQTLIELNPQLVFIYVSGAGTDSTEAGRVRWARVKGATENALLRLPFRAYAFRPGFIQPLHGVRSKTRLYRTMYLLTAPLMPVLGRLLPAVMTTTERIGIAMLEVARHPGADRIVESADINRLAAAATR